MELIFDKKFNCILADPPWKWKTRSAKGLDGRPQHYERMTLTDIKNMPVEQCADKDCFLFLWTTGPHLEQAFEVIKAWGFKYSAIVFTWVKLKNKMSDAIWVSPENDFHMGMGYTTRKNTEICLLGRRGSPKRLDKSVRELLISGVREHSRKPEEAYRRIERFCGGDRLELFARNQREGWTSFGNEVGKFED